MTVLTRPLSAAWAVRQARQERRLRPILDGTGELRVGRDVIFALGPVRTRVSVGDAALCAIGDRVFVGHGTSISCDQSVTIGDDARLGPFTLLYDSDFHVAGAHDLRVADAQVAPAKTGAVHIGSGVRIGEFVTILRGTTIEDGAVIAPGTVVRGYVSANEHASGRAVMRTPGPISSPT